MNQILNTKLKKNKKYPKRKIWFKFQFVFSLSVLSILTIGGMIYFYHLQREEEFSRNLIATYQVYQLYKPVETISKETEEAENGLFGMIQIPKINLYYPVFSYLTEDLLKIAPCKFYGNTPTVNGNLCIAGHNYDNALFFSKISSLIPNDEIFIFDSNGVPYIYLVYDKYEVSETDLSPILNYLPNEKILTLVTCNNLNNNRIIIKAKQKKLF